MISREYQLPSTKSIWWKYLLHQRVSAVIHQVHLSKYLLHQRVSAAIHKVHLSKYLLHQSISCHPPSPSVKVSHTLESISSVIHQVHMSKYLLHQRVSAVIHQVHLVEVSPTPDSISRHPPSPSGGSISYTRVSVVIHQVHLVEVSPTPENISCHPPSPSVEVCPTPESIICHPPSPSGGSISYTRDYQLSSTKSIWSKYLLHQRVSAAIHQVHLVEVSPTPENISCHPPSPSVEVSPTPESISCHPPSPSVEVSPTPEDISCHPPSPSVEVSPTPEYQLPSTKSIWWKYLLHQRLSAVIHQVHLVEVSPTPETISSHPPSPSVEVSPTP